MSAVVKPLGNALRLQLQGDPPAGQLANLTPNPHGELGGWGYLTPVAHTIMEGYPNSSGVRSLRYDPFIDDVVDVRPQWFTTDDVPIVPGVYVAASWRIPAAGYFYRARFEFLNAEHVLLTASAQSAYFGGPGVTGTFQLAPVTTAIVDAAFVRLRIDVYNDAAGANPVQGRYLFLDDVMIAQAATAAGLADMTFREPIAWVDVLGTTHDITVTREGMNVGSLTAHIVDSTLDPSQSSIVRPGRAVQLLARDDDGDVWRPLFTGTTAHAVCQYMPDRVDEAKRCDIELSAIDNVQKLANQKRGEGVATVVELPYVLEGCGVPWNVNGSGSGVPVATVVSTSDTATALDQVAVTRDSQLGLAWVNRMGVLYAIDRAHVPVDPLVLLDEAAYVDIGISFDSQTLVNEVTVHLLVFDGEETTEVAHGPYRDEASIATWGVASADYTVQGMADDEPTIAAYAQQILTANSTPVVRLNGMQLHVDVTNDWSSVASPFAWLDLYDVVAVTCERAGMADDPAQVVAVSHDISGPDSKWQMTLAFNAPTGSSSSARAATAATEWPVALPTIGPGPTAAPGGGGGTTFIPGAGLGMTGDDLHVNVDGASIEISADAVRLKDGGVTGPKLAPNSVTTGNVVDGSLTAADLAPGTIPSVPSSLPPSGPAGGDLTGSYPNPTIGAGKVTSSHIADGTIVAADLSSALASSIANAAVDSLVVHKAGAETITGTKTLDVPLVQSFQGTAPPVPPAGKATGPYFGADGLPYFETPSGVVVPFNIGDVQTALHANPSFELVTGSLPTSWDTFWQNGATVTTETVDVLFGTRSLTVGLAAAVGSNQLLMSSVFAVAPGDLVDVSAWARAVSGAPQLILGIMSAASGTPAPFDGVSTNQQTEAVALTSTFTKYGKSFTVPAGHTVCRITIRVGKAAGDATAPTARLDYTGSSRTGASQAVLPGNSWPKEAVRCVDTSTASVDLGVPNVVDGVSLAVGDRVLKATPSGPATNGIYTVITVGTGTNGVWQRASDALTSAQLAGAEVAVAAGTLYGGTRWGTSFKATDVVGTTSQLWSQVGLAAEWITALLTSGFTVPTTVATVPFTTKAAGGGGISVNGSGQVVVARAGIYHVATQLEYVNSGTGYVNYYLRHWRSGVQQSERQTVESGNGWRSASMVSDYDCVAGDIVEVLANAQAAGVTLEAVGQRAQLVAHRIF